MTERFTYEVRPHTPIKELVPGRVIVKPTTTKLTKEEVLICMKHGPVYRLFPGKTPIRVLGANLDQLHQAELVESKNEVKASNYTENAEFCTREQEGVSEEPKTDEVTEAISTENTSTTETEISEEAKEKDTEVDSVDVVEAYVEKEVAEAVEEKAVEAEEPTIESEVAEDVTEVVEEEEAEEEEVEETPSNPANVINVKTNYNKYNKKNRKH
jgi:hypothetical protein